MTLPNGKLDPLKASLSLHKNDEQGTPESDRHSQEKTNPRVKLGLVDDDTPKTSENLKEKRKKSNRFFYKVSNHQELFRIGRSFYDDFVSGVKSFAISSTGYQTSQQKTILGLASFFDHKDDYNIAIISDNLREGVFKDIVSISKDVSWPVFEETEPLRIKSFYNHFDFINLEDLLDLANNSDLEAYDEVFDQVVDSYDIVFWDVPELHKVQMDSERYFPMIMKFESISIIVAKKLSKQSDIEDLKKFFLGYGINLKGLLFEERNSIEKTENMPKRTENQKDKRPWWKRLVG